MIDWQRSYCGVAPGPDGWATRWNFDPVLLVVLGLVVVACLRLHGSRRHAGLAAVAAALVAFVSPLCALSVALFSARAVHHLVVVAVVAPLLAVAWPPRRGGIAAALPVSTVLLWAWHVPALYDAALANVAIYWAMQATLLAGFWWFWGAIRRASPAEAVAGIAGGAVQMGFLGALLTFATRPLYESHLVTTVPFGIGPLVDQQLAGLVMWVPGMAPYAVAAAWIAARRWHAFAATAAAAT